ncbi:MAG: hypothetical protein J6Y72_11810 [Bacteroidales bacterium]|nr:hypothetical protein [Bacteroidales bacterium]
MKGLIFIIAILFTASMHAQEVQMSGIVLNNATMMPMTDALVKVNGNKYLVDAAGRTMFEANRGDTVSITHIGFQPLQFVVADSVSSESMFAVVMSEDTIRLSEIMVMQRPKVHINPNMPIEQRTVMAETNFKYMTHLAQNPPASINSAWDAQQNQDAAISRETNKMVYRHMIAPDQMVGISFTTTLALISGLIAKIREDGNSQSHIRPIDTREFQILMRNYKYEQ